MNIFAAMRLFFYGFILLLGNLKLQSQEIMKLYEGQPPFATVADVATEKTTNDGLLRISDVSLPELHVWKPAKPNGTAVLIFPGGGYRILAFEHEGTDVAKWLAAKGITAIVVKYRLPNAAYMTKPSHAPLTDALSAVSLVRGKAAAWGLDTEKIGVMGFSAGGHLAASASTHFHDFDGGRFAVSGKPSFSILVYPVIRTGKEGHAGSTLQLLGNSPADSLLAYFNNVQQVTSKTPPAILFHTTTDATVPVSNSIDYAKALLNHGQKATLHIYHDGPHGFGMKPVAANAAYAGWLNDLAQWLRSMQLSKE